MFRKSYLIGLWLLLATLAPQHLLADTFPDEAGIYLQKADGEEKYIGRVEFGSGTDDNVGIKVDIDTGAFTEHFLSMRPFRCIESPGEWACYLQYPYSLRNVISATDLSDLEYQLMFIKKLRTEFGIDAWNGLYYKLSLQDDGSITGVLFEGDLNSLQSPPPNKYDKPVDMAEFIEANKQKRLYPTLIIRAE